MVDVPSEVTLECDQPRLLAKLMTQLPETDSIRIDERAGQITIATRSAAELYNQLARRLVESGVRVFRVSSTDDSLQSLFNSLMRIHRGEL